MCKPIANDTQRLPIIQFGQIAQFFEPMEFVEHAAVFVGLLQVFEQSRKKSRSQCVLQFGESKNELVPILNGFIAELRQCLGRQWQSGGDG